MDLFPHIEYLESTEEFSKDIKAGRLRQKIADAVKVFLDFSAGLLLVFLFSDNDALLYVYALASIVPDGLTVINFIFPNKVTKIHQKFHGEKIHFLKYKKISVFWRILTQISATIVGIILLKI